MSKILLRSFLSFLLLFQISALAFGQQKVTDDAPEQALAALKKNDKLSEWIYLRLDYVYPEPQKRLKFLLETQQKVWRKPVNDEEKVSWLLLLSSQGYYQLQNGNILGSINCYEDAHQYYDAHNTIDFNVAEYIYKPLSNNYTRLGDYERAIFVQKSTLKLALEIKNNALAVSTRGNLAISYRSMGKFDLALKEINEGLRTAGALTEGGIMLNNVKADIFYDLQDYKAAEEIVKLNIKVQERGKIDGNTAYPLFGSYVALGNVLFKRNALAAANAAYGKSLTLLNRFYAAERQRERAHLLNQLGKIALAQRNALQAIGYFNSGLKIFGLTGTNNQIKIDRIYGDNNVIEALYNRAFAYLQLKQPGKALEELQYALFAADRIRFELADEKTRQRFQLEIKAIAEKAIAIAYSQYKRTGAQLYAQTILNIAEQSKARTLLDAVRKNQQQALLKQKDTLFTRRQMLERAIIFNEKQQLIGPGKSNSNDMLQYELSLVEGALRKKYPALAAQSELSESKYQDLMANVKQGQHFLEYFTGDSSIYMIHVFGKKVVDVKAVAGAEKLKKEIVDYVVTYFNNGPDAMLNDPQVFYNRSFSLYKQIVPATFDNVKAYTVIPDGVLGYLSFDGLVTDSNYQAAISKWPYLIKKSMISYAFSLQTLLKKNDIKGKQQPFTGFFISHEEDKQAFLPAVKEEADAIRKNVSGAFFFDRAASSSNLLAAINKPGVLHLSTHAALIGPQQAPVLGMADHEVFLFELSATAHAPDLVVLSACQTANGALQNGEGIISFSRGFAALGAKGTIAGLWNLNDQAAADIMATFYKNLAVGMPVSAALRAAKLNQLAQPKSSEALYLPYYWNALVYMGNDQQLLISAGINYTLIIAGTVGFLIIVLVVFLFRRKIKEKK